METQRMSLTALVNYVSRDPQAELECKVLPNQIKTKDVADRIAAAIAGVSTGSATEEHRATFSYPDNVRVVVTQPENIFKICATSSFRGTKLLVERKSRYFEGRGSESDLVDLPDVGVRFTLRREEELRRDFTGAPMDPVAHVRILHRRSWTTLDGLLRFDFSLVKSRGRGMKTLAEVMRQQPAYELEVEVVDRKASPKAIVDSLFRHVTLVLEAFQGTPFLLSKSDVENYRMGFQRLGFKFINPVTMDRRHMSKECPMSVLTGYTVTNKADGDRCFLVVATDKRVIRVTPNMNITWTGLTATKDIHVGDVLDGEYLADRNMFCIFDVYAFRGKNTTRLPLMLTDEDLTTTSRLGCSREFIKDLTTDFITTPSQKPLSIESKVFLAGDGPIMEQAINTLLNMEFGYPTDGLIFTPKASAVAPMQDRRGNTWLRVYKWKPADQNSIDFLLRFKAGESYDTVLKSHVFKGSLYVSRNRGSDILYPRETLTGEYTPPAMPADLQRIAETRDRAPSPFQPSVPRKPDANIIALKLEKGAPVDKYGNRIEDNTIVECAYDTETNHWTVLRTRHDKTYQYRVLGEPQFGNDIAVAESIWTNIHVPITETMIRHLASDPIDDLAEDDLYYRDNLDARDRILKDVYSFHNRVKEQLYQTCIKPGDTLLELAVGRAGDMLKWKRSKPKLVVGFDISESNLTSSRQGGYVRYLKDAEKPSCDKLPPMLLVVGDMTKPLYESDDRYVRILNGSDPAPTTYLQQFKGVKEFDDISCQFAIHYACVSEEAFRAFTENLKIHGKKRFFGTCMDGAAVYALLLGKKNHIFRADGQVFGEFTKEYPDGDAWRPEFGQTLRVYLESFEKPVQEALVPFERVVELLKEVGYELDTTQLFQEYYSQQTAITLTQEQQAFSFLHRSFVFTKVDTPAPPSPPEEEEAIELPTTADAESAAASTKEVAPKAKRRTLTVKVPVDAKVQPGADEKPVFFYGADESKGEFRFMSNMYVAPFEIDGITYPTVEHYFQWSKAKLFKDEAAATKILTPPKGKPYVEAKSAKAIGKKVKDFDGTQWNGLAPGRGFKDEVMRKAIRAKFTHPKNTEMLEKLLATKDRVIAEANPRDSYWGIGTSADTKPAQTGKWKGQNFLGKMLMELRTEIRGEKANA
jgi:ribA/ribD-fused uncharacterized protein